MNFSFWGLFKKRTKEEIEIVKTIQSLVKRYPSIKVVGRGTIVIDPKEICR